MSNTGNRLFVLATLFGLIICIMGIIAGQLTEWMSWLYPMWLVISSLLIVIWIQDATENPT